MATINRGALEKKLRNLGFSKRKARQAVQSTFDVMAKWLAADRRLPLELGLGESKEVCGEFKVRPQLHKSRTISRGGNANQLFTRRWQIVWEDSHKKKPARAKRPAPRELARPVREPASTPARPQPPAEVCPQMPESREIRPPSPQVQWLPLSSVSPRMRTVPSRTKWR
jgi:hypothetical protein